MPQTVLSHSLFSVALEPVEIQPSSALPMPMLPSVRHYTCARCRRQVFICRHCDRGNHYCAGACAVEARRESLRQAGSRYRATPPGRHHNAARQQRFRDRQNEKVTHQGSLSLRALVLLLPARNAGERGPDREGTATRNGIFCHFCHGQCDSYLRNRFLPRIGTCATWPHPVSWPE